MAAIDEVFGMDWAEARYIGDGVYMLDSSDHTGIPSVAIRTDREFRHFVIVLEDNVFEDMVKVGQAMLARQMNMRRAITGPADVYVAPAGTPNPDIREPVPDEWRRFPDPEKD